MSCDSATGCYEKSSKRKWVRHPVADAYLYFHRSIENWLVDGEGAEAERISALYEALRTQIRVVAIDLTKEDDAQVIFETLNARGTPLLPSDLVKNLLFHRLAQEPVDLALLYQEYWGPFDEDADYWRAETGRGHARRPTIDTFLQHYLACQMGDVVQVAHLFTTYRDYAADLESTESELQDLRRLADTYRSFERQERWSREELFFRRLKLLNVTSAYPFLLSLFDRHGEDGELVREVLIMIESFLLRRLITRLSTRGYGRLFIELMQVVAEDGETPARGVRAYLLESDADFRRWPDDAEFQQAWKTQPAYRFLRQQRLRMVLEALEMGMRTSKSEKLEFKEKLTVEHLLPRRWKAHYPPPDGAGADELSRREVLKESMGNLTLLTEALNPSISNGPWTTKREEILEHSALALNRDLKDETDWAEPAIERRSDRLFDVARKVWPGPDQAVAK